MIISSPSRRLTSFDETDLELAMAAGQAAADSLKIKKVKVVKAKATASTSTVTAAKNHSVKNRTAKDKTSKDKASKGTASTTTTATKASNNSSDKRHLESNNLLKKTRFREILWAVLPFKHVFFDTCFNFAAKYRRTGRHMSTADNITEQTDACQTAVNTGI